MFTKIGKILKGRALSLFDERAAAAVGPSLARDLKPLKLDGGTLTVACRSAAAASALRASEHSLREGLSEAGVERLRVLLSPWR